ncbi:MAG: CopG family transcriptional regulator [Deltaproteobacteria bacterium]|nr:CopG family transcriptional regulator [Deltaproteobacteria bacterium]
MSHRVLTTHVPSALAKEDDSVAERLDRPRGWILKAALEQYLALERTRHELTLEALAEVDAGQTEPHEEVVRWAASLPKRPRRR